MVTDCNRMSARLIWQRAIKGEDWWKSIEGLVDYARKRGPEDTTPKQLLLYLLGYHEACGTSKEDMLKVLHDSYGILDRIRTNAFTFQQGNEAKHIDLGMAMSPVGALFNHSCDPNMGFSFPNGTSVKNCLHFISTKYTAVHQLRQSGRLCSQSTKSAAKGLWLPVQVYRV